ncbi:hypothetical protein [Streptomyces justiciae]|uniref:hypothetical protein n=1 Tax=Streptomyces justiciae TaxID=2780140 RepID=UPI002117AD64|nr:hypothetical protein [Streptomyces justiciae]MCW8381641.1 hypothetical protein [Streptomyces justiciae]
MGERLRVSTDDLETAGTGLRTVATELEGLDKLMDQYDRRTVGHQQLHERLQDFSDGWDDNRKKMIEEIQGLGKVAHEAGKAYKELDTALYNALIGKGKKK